MESQTQTVAIPETARSVISLASSVTSLGTISRTAVKSQVTRRRVGINQLIDRLKSS
jgi:hypothetical protein